MDALKLISEEKVLRRFYGKGLLERTYEFPDGTQEKFYVVSGQTPVIIFALTEQNEVIAVRQFRYGANEIVLELPGGVAEKEELPREAVERELLQETGYIPREIVALGHPIYFDPASFTVSFLPFLAMGCQKKREPKLEKTEIMETVLIPFKEWIEMIHCGFVRDSKSISTTIMALGLSGFEIRPKKQ